MKFLTSVTLISLALTAQNAMAQLGGGTKGSVPEPGIWALMGVGAAAFAVRHFMRKR